MSARVPGPVIVASGCGGTGRELEPFLGPDGLAGLDLVTRSLTLKRREGGPAPRIEESPGGLVNAVGLPNPGLEQFLATELPWLVRAGTRVHVSVAGSSLGEYADLARRLSRAPGVAGLEVNLGVPDETGWGVYQAREPFQSASAVAAVRREFPADLPVLAKLRPDVSRIVEGARACADAGATAVVVGNTVPAAFTDGRSGGLSGPAVLPLALRCVAEVHRALPDLAVIGCGGVRDLATARAFLDAGARAVQVGTALLHDPTTVARLRADLATAQTAASPDPAPGPGPGPAPQEAP